MAERTFRAIGRPDLITDPRFRTNADRVKNAAILDGTGERVVAPALGADLDDIDVAAEREPRAAAGTGQGEAPERVALRFRPGPVRVRADRREVVLAKLGPQPERLAALGEKLEHRLLVAGERRNPDGGREVRDKRVRPQCRYGVGARAGSSSWRAAI